MKGLYIARQDLYGNCYFHKKKIAIWLWVAVGTKNKPKTLIQKNPLYKPGSGGSPSALTALGDGIVKRKHQREATNHVRIMTWQVGVGSHCRSGTCRSGIRETRSLHREKRASRRNVYTNKRNIYQVTDALFIVIAFFPLSLLLPHQS